MTDGARQVSFQSKLLSTLIFFYRQNMNKNVLPTSRRNFLEGVEKKKTKNFPAQNLKIALSLYWNQRQFSSFQAPLLSLSSTL